MAKPKRIDDRRIFLPDIELMVRSLRVSHPFSFCRCDCRQRVPDPLGTEMGVISDLEALLHLVVTWVNLKQMLNMDMQDMRFPRRGRDHSAKLPVVIWPRFFARAVTGDPRAVQTVSPRPSPQRRNGRHVSFRVFRWAHW
jgi:hypothetical protein